MPDPAPVTGKKAEERAPGEDGVMQRDLDWLKNVYKGDTQPQLTVRAIVTGMIFGGIMSVSNLYIGLKSGWGLGVDIAAIIVMFAIFKGLKSVGLVRKEFGMMESTIMMTAAVAASWISSAGLVSAVPALTMLTGYQFVWWQLTLLIGVILYSGLFMAIPFKRQMIQVDHLRFPGNVPTGETLKAMYSAGGEAMKKAKALMYAGVSGLLLVALRDVLASPKIAVIGAWMKPQYELHNPFTGGPIRIHRIPLSKLTLTIEPSFIFIGIGALMGIKVGVSMLFGFLFNYAVMAPNLIENKIIKHAPPQVRAEALMPTPLAVQAGQQFVLVIREANTSPVLDDGSRMDTLRYTWIRPAMYASAADLKRDFVDSTLNDRVTLNPFFHVIGVRDTMSKILGDTVMFFEATKANTWESQLSLLPSTNPEIAESLGFAPRVWNAGYVEHGWFGRLFSGFKRPAWEKDSLTVMPAKLPVSANSGDRLTVLIKNTEKPAKLFRSSKVDTFTYTWTRPASYTTVDQIVRDLNAPTLLDGTPNPLPGKISAAVKHNSLALFANRSTRYDMMIDRSNREFQVLMGFAPGSNQIRVVGGFRNISAWSLWPGATVLVVGGLLALAFQWKTLGRTFGSIFSSFGGKKKNGKKGVLDHIEIPMTWFVPGFLITGFASMVLLMWLFNIHWYMGLIAVLLTFFLAAVAARAGAEIGINPIGALGKVTQLTFGAISPGNMTTNLMTASVTAGASASCSDTIGNLFVGHMVGANPRKQFIAQLFGVIAGAFMAVPAYFLLVPDASVLGGDKYPAPSALVWQGVAKVLSQGLHTLPPSAVIAIVVAFVLGVTIVIVDKVFPKAKPYTPSPAALGIAMTIPAYTSFSMFLGAFIVWILEKNAAKWNDMNTVPIASGWIAGESIAGVVVALLLYLGYVQ